MRYAIGLSLHRGSLRHSRNNELTAEQVEQTAQAVAGLQAALHPPDVVLIRPRRLCAANEQFVRAMCRDSESLPHLEELARAAPVA